MHNGIAPVFLVYNILRLYRDNGPATSVRRRRLIEILSRILLSVHYTTLPTL